MDAEDKNSRQSGWAVAGRAQKPFGGGCGEGFLALHSETTALVTPASLTGLRIFVKYSVLTQTAPPNLECLPLGA